jgi:hypothetical protein
MHIKEFLVKEKKFFVFGVTAVLLTLSLALAGCGGEEETPIDPGSVTFGVDVPGEGEGEGEGDTNGTLVPDGILDTIKSYAVAYKPAANNTHLQSGVETFDADATANITFNLPPGEYDFTIKGYTVTADKIVTTVEGETVKAVPIAQANAPAVKTGQPPKTVLIGPIPSDTETGTFEWAFPASIDTKIESLTLEYLDAPKDAPVIRNILEEKSESAANNSYNDLLAGSYLLSAHLASNYGHYEVAVHIYAGQTTKAENLPPKEYYVNTATGNDIYTGTTAAVAFKTLQTALDAPFLLGRKTILLEGGVTINGGEVTINGDDQGKGYKTIITRPDGKNDAVIRVTGGAAVTFTNVTIDGKYNDSVYHPGLSITGAGTKVTLGAGTVVTGRNGASGGGISAGAGTTLVMKAGSAVKDSTGNYAGGIYANGAAVMMEDGSVVEGNTANYYGGGVYLIGSSTLTMDGNAKISDNTAVRTGGGVLMEDSTLKIGGTAEISGNKSAEDGGGIGSAGNAVVEMSGDAKISGNKAPVAGGVTVWNMNFTMTGGTFSGNQATAGKGGGVYVYGTASGATASIFTMTGGTIYGSNASSETLRNTATGDGAALYKEEGGTAKLRDDDLGTTNDTIQ